MHDSLIHPLRFAEQVMQTRSRLQRDDRQKGAVLADVYVFRGLPSNRLRIPGRNLWHTALGGEEFLASRDRKDYTAHFHAAPRGGRPVDRFGVPLGGQ